MQLDDTLVAVRKRDLGEIMDLALKVVASHPWPLLAAWTVGATPVIVLNALLLGDPRQHYPPNPDFLMGHMFLTVLMAAWLAPVATAPLTLVLGQVMFNQKVRPAQLAGSLLGSLPQLVWYQVIIRGLLTVLVMPLVIHHIARPFLSEVILLERNPWWSRRGGPITTRQRSKWLHARHHADLTLRWMASLGVGILMTVSAWGAMVVLCRQTILPQPEDSADPTLFWLSFGLLGPLAIWLVLGFFAVVRFLAYIDLRIRSEGWDVELLMRAERARLLKQTT